MAQRGVPRVRAASSGASLSCIDQAQDDATLLAIRAFEQAGIDVITDGEMRRESYSNRFATALDGIDVAHPAGSSRARPAAPCWCRAWWVRSAANAPVEVRDLEFLRANTQKQVKITLPGPFSMSVQAQDDYYGDPRALALAYAEAANAEIRDLYAAGADVVQLDEPWFRNAPDRARQYGVEVVDRAFKGVNGTKALHMCFGYAALVTGKQANRYAYLEELAESCRGPDLDRSRTTTPRSCPAEDAGRCWQDDGARRARPRRRSVETPEQVAERIRAALRYVPAEQLMVAPDCGMKYLPREVAFGKLLAMVEGAAMVRRELQ